MKLKKSDVNLLLVIIGIGIAALSYFTLYKNLTEKTETIQAENAVLEQEVNRLQELADNQQQYLSETETMNTEIAEIESKFAASYRPEDEILYVKGLEESFDADASTIAMPGSAQIGVDYTPSEDLVPINMTSEVAAAEEAPAEDAVDGEEAAPVEEAPAVASSLPNVALYGTPVTISFVASYNSVKELLKTMNEDEMRKSIDSVTLSFDGESGDLSGSLAFKMYSITGTDKVYEVPKIDGVQFGTNNIFNSADKKAAIEAQKSAEAQANAETEE